MKIQLFFTPRRLLLAAFAWLLIALVITYFDWQGRLYTLGHGRSYALKLYIFWAQFAALPLFLAGLLRLKQGWVGFSGLRRALAVLYLTPLLALIWAGQIEPNILYTRSTTLTFPQAKAAGAAPIKIALVADIHWGLFVRDWQLSRLVDKLNSLEVDAILVAGDWTYEPNADLQAGFAAFKRLKKPVFAVLGNHDTGRPGPKKAQHGQDFSSALRTALEANSVQFLEGKNQRFNGWQFVGIDDLWGGQSGRDIQALLTAGNAANRIALTHQPDTAAFYPPNAAALTLAGHTHGGQVNLPIATQWVLARTMRQPWYNALYETQFGKVFVNSGTGMVGLPLRFAVPPRIDVLSLQPQ